MRVTAECLLHVCFVLAGQVYDVTGYVDGHPGGDAILENVGDDSSEGFHGPQHPATVRDVLDGLYVGDLEKEE